MINCLFPCVCPKSQALRAGLELSSLDVEVLLIVDNLGRWMLGYQP